MIMQRYKNKQNQKVAIYFGLQPRTERRDTTIAVKVLLDFKQM